MLPNNLNLLPHEIKHYETLNELASECTLFLKRDNAFPVANFSKVALFGGGVRNTAKGGTGSGDVNSHFFNRIEEEFELRGYEVTTKKWLDAYDKLYEFEKAKHVKKIKAEAKKAKMNAAAYSVGFNMPEFEHDLSLEEYDADICIYVLKRVSGEDADRQLVKGDIYFTDKEIEDILYLNKKFERFMLVLNVSGVIDLSPVLEVRNIYLLSQLGVVTPSILVNVITGKNNPSGKLSTSWARPVDYPFFEEFGDINDTYYKEGIYIGYRYFNSVNKKPLFPFGYGLSYSEFKLKLESYKIIDDLVSLKVNVKNISKYEGKEVVQVYLSCRGDIETPKDILVAFKKSGVIKPDNDETIELNFKLSDFPIFDIRRHAYIIQKGKYVVRLGVSSIDLMDSVLFEIDEDVIVKEVESLNIETGFEDLSVKRNDESSHSTLKCEKVKIVQKNDVKVSYFSKYSVEIPDFIKGLSIDDLIHMNLGDYKTGLAGVIGQSCSLVPGGAGETTLRVKGLEHSLSMADGPAGLRLISEYVLTKNRVYNLKEDSIWRDIKPYLPSIITSLLDVKRNQKRKGSVIYQYCTAIPIATAIAQSFNDKLAFNIGRLVKEEMEIYDVDIWLAPALNIHRNILCGRNFEYYSEDPYLSSVMASSIVNGVQKDSNKICTIKHFACNNQETNRFNNNSVLSERALREIYLSGFEKTIKESNPLCVMTSYNLINGVHASESHDLLTKILRCEWGYKGLVMTDWIKTGQINNEDSIHPYKHAYKDLINGVNICMPGSKADIKDIKQALKRHLITRDDLENNASIVYQLIEK